MLKPRTPEELHAAMALTEPGKAIFVTKDELDSLFDQLTPAQSEGVRFPRLDALLRRATTPFLWVVLMIWITCALVIGGPWCFAMLSLLMTWCYFDTRRHLSDRAASGDICSTRGGRG